MNFKSINETRTELVGLLEGYRGAELSDRYLSSVERCTARIREGRFKIAIFGEFSNGKSTLLNAMMRLTEEILVVDELPCTAAITVLQAPPSPELLRKAQITFRNPNRPPELIPMEEAKNYSAKAREVNGTARGSKVEDEVAEVRIYLDSPLLEDGVEIIDTPGLNSAYPEHTKITRGIMDRADAAIFLFDYEQAGKATEMEVMRLLSDYISKAFLVLNKIDLAERYNDCDQRIDDVCDDLRKKLIDQKVNLGDDKRIYPVSAKWAFKAHAEGDKMLWEKSRFEDLADALQVYLCSPDFQRDKLYAPLKRLQYELYEVQRINKENFASAAASAEELRLQRGRAEEALKEEKKRVKNATAELQKAIQGVFKDERSRLSGTEAKLQDNILSKIEKNNSEYRIKYYQSGGGDYRQEVVTELLGAWEDTTRRILDKTIQVLAEHLAEDEREEEVDLCAQLEEIILRSLDLGAYASEEKFTLDLSEVEAKRKELDDMKKDLDRNAEKIGSLIIDAARRDHLRAECANLERKIRQTEQELDDARHERAGIKPARYQRQVIHEEDRDGVLGKVAQVLVGRRRVMDVEIVEDTDAANNEGERIDKKIQKTQEHQQQLKEQHEQARQKVEEKENLDFILDEARASRSDMRAEMNRQMEQLEDLRDAQESLQIQAFQEKMKKQISIAVNSFVGKAQSVLRKISSRVAAYSGELLQDSPELIQCQTRLDEIVKLSIASESEREAQSAKLKRENETIADLCGALEPYHQRGENLNDCNF